MGAPSGRASVKEQPQLEKERDIVKDLLR